MQMIIQLIDIFIAPPPKKSSKYQKRFIYYALNRFYEHGVSSTYTNIS